MTRRANTPQRIATVFVISIVAFLFLAADRSLTQNVPLFLAPVTYSSGGEFNTSVALGDVNGDGKLDIVAANFCVPNCEAAQVGGFEVLLGNGDGTFQTGQVYSLASGQGASIALADLNGDGKLDVVISISPSVGCFAEGGGGSVGVFLGNGDGTFRPEKTYQSGGLCTSKLIVADVNRDGKSDVIVAGACGSNQSYCSESIDGIISVLRGNGDGSFQAAQTYDSGGVFPRDMTVADVNSDGKLDLLVANGGSEQQGAGNGNVAALLGNGDGTFQPVEIFNTFSPYAGELASLAVADLNGDGKPDVAETTCFYFTCAQNTGELVVQLGNGDGTFQAPQVYSTGRSIPSSVVLADVNLEGKLDAVLVSNGECPDCPTGGVSVLLGNGDGTFSTFHPSARFSSGGSVGVSAAIGDVNGDGRLDVVVANQYTVCGPHCNTPEGAVGVLLGARSFLRL